MSPSDPAVDSAPRNGWTGGQYSLVRGALGLWLAWQFLRLAPVGVALARPRNFQDEPPETIWTTLPNVFALWAAPEFAQGVLVASAGLALCLAIGKWDRLAAVLAWYVWACCYAREPALTGPTFPLLSWMLAVHAALPAAPFGSWEARGRVDPRGGWQMPAGVYLGIWGMLTAIHAVLGGQKLLAHGWDAGERLAHGASWTGLPISLLTAAAWLLIVFHLSFGFIALWRPARPAVWLLSLALAIASVGAGVPLNLMLGLVIAHLLALDPAWIPPLAAAIAPESSGGASAQPPAETLFYDGHCGLCQRSVRMIVAEDRIGGAFRFSPLGSDLFQRLIPEAERAKLPDSMLVRPNDGSLLLRSAGILYVLQRLGGLWRVLGGLAAIIPRPLADAAYSGLARIRHRLFAKPADACPIMPRDLRSRFEM